jgi:putative SOS response-associated peptidase YedK
MCGRYTLQAPADELVEVFGVDELTFEDWQPRYNLAPTQDAPVILRGRAGERRMGLMRWGLVPYWADDPGIGNKLINARSETVATKPAFRDAFAARRCLVLADGFYEWQKTAGGKVPWWIHRPDRRPFAFAGLWERWRPGGQRAGGAEGRGSGERTARGDALVTFTILTTEPNARVRALHDRMPAVLPDRAAEEAWLDPRTAAAELAALLAPAPENFLDAWPVSTAVNRPANDEPELVERVGRGSE